MSRRICILFAVIAAGFAVSGCVSTGEFEKMQAEKNKEITALKQQTAELAAQKADLERQSADLARQKSELEQQMSALVQQNATIKQQVDTLKQQKSVLEQQTSELAGQKTDLERQSANLARQKSELEQQMSALAQQNTAIQQQVGTLEQQKASLLAASQLRKQQYDALVNKLSQEVEKGQLQVRQYQNMLSVDLAEKVFFDSGQAVLKPEGRDVLKKVGDALKGYENKVIRVVGHTDNVPISKVLQPTFPTNWELSVARATTVVRFLQDVGIPPERMVASGRSKYDPVATNDTPEGRQENRRIEIMIIDQNLVKAIERSSN